jgi:hypothetical protein
MRADRAVIFKLAAEIERWPLFLPHYRWVRLLRVSPDGNQKIAEMAARRDWFPVRWTAVQTLYPAEYRITFRHVRGVTRGMWVEWTMTPTTDGILVKITHDFRPAWGPLSGAPTERIIGHGFVGYIAGRTLRCVKATAEAAMVAAASGA